MQHDDSILPPHVLRRLAAAADVDPRTVARYLRGNRVRVGAVAERIARVVADAGLAKPRGNGKTASKNGRSR